MIIGIPKEIKNHEYRIGLTPDSVKECVNNGHDVIIEINGGMGINATNEDYIAAGAKIIDTAEEIFAKSDMIVKIKEPLAQERKLLKEGQVLFTYLHLAPDEPQAKDLINSGSICIACETVTSDFNTLPLLAPMSKVAGRMSIQVGAYCLEKTHGGSGMLLGGVPGQPPAKVLILGAGIVGNHATHIAVGMGSNVWVFDNNVSALEKHWRQFGNLTNTVFSTNNSILEHIKDADLIIGGILIPGAESPKLITRNMLKDMKKGSVLVDVSIDQGGCFATSKATTHDNPTYIIDDIVHYCVANMPGGVAKTSSYAFNNATLPFVLNIANKGYKKALADDKHLLNGLNVYQGKITHKEVAKSLNYDYYPAENFI